nr:3-dehydroquinate synthase [Actinomycetota bacterium]
VLDYLGFPMTRRFDPERVKMALRGDKKREQGAIRWILPLEVGRVSEVGNVTDAEVDSAMARIQAT